MKNIGIVTSTRAEYGLLMPFIREMRKHESKSFKISLIVTGTHLSKKYGMTVSEIEASGIRIDDLVPIRLKSNSANEIARNQADIVVKFTDLFAQRKYDAICILGDRYEIQMIALAATNVGIPIFHLCGGDTTEGAVDESARHSITKMSYWHFTTNEESRRRVIQLGEEPQRVFNVGSTSIDNILNMDLFCKEEVLRSVGLQECRYAIGTYHPVTLENQDIEIDILNFVNAMKLFPGVQFIITKANADKGGELINSILDREAGEIPNIHVFSSLGTKRYLSIMKYAEFVIGNSSSGIVEAPALHVPTVNIGDRQKGRLQSESTINCGTGLEEIASAIRKAMSPEMKRIADKVVSPYGDGRAAERMTKIVLEAMERRVDLKKHFYMVN